MCNGTDHNLIAIHQSSIGYDEYAVVRWCKDCGAVVIDSEIDNRTNPGKIRQMMFPSYRINNNGSG